MQHGKQVVFRNVDSTLKKTHHVSITKTNIAMLFRETLAAYCWKYATRKASGI
jgi:hypothetical protein